MSAEKGSSKADTLVKVVLVFFISLLSFSVGTFVGKQVSDSDHRRMALEGEYKGDRKIASADGHDHDAGDHEEKISEKEVESLTEEFVSKEAAAREPAEANEHDEADAHGGDDKHAKKETHGEHAAPEASEEAESEGYKSYNRKTASTPAKHEAKHDSPTDTHHDVKAQPKVVAKIEPHDAPSKAADKVIKGHAPTDGMREERKPNAVLPSVASSAVGKYTVQVAAYADEKQAKDYAATLKGKGWQAFYLSAPVNGATWYRVSVGLFENIKSANDFRTQLMREANVPGAMVKKIIQ